jgi:hypothetical protein
MFGCAKPPDMLAISRTATDFLQHNRGRFLFDADVSSRCAQSSTLDRRLART